MAINWMVEIHLFVLVRISKIDFPQLAHFTDQYKLFSEPLLLFTHSSLKSWSISAIRSLSLQNKKSKQNKKRSLSLSAWTPTTPSISLLVTDLKLSHWYSTGEELCEAWRLLKLKRSLCLKLTNSEKKAAPKARDRRWSHCQILKKVSLEPKEEGRITTHRRRPHRDQEIICYAKTQRLKKAMPEPRDRRKQCLGSLFDASVFFVWLAFAFFFIGYYFIISL